MSKLKEKKNLKIEFEFVDVRIACRQLALSLSTAHNALHKWASFMISEVFANKAPIKSTSPDEKTLNNQESETFFSFVMQNQLIC